MGATKKFTDSFVDKGEHVKLKLDIHVRLPYYHIMLNCHTIYPVTPKVSVGELMSTDWGYREGRIVI